MTREHHRRVHAKRHLRAALREVARLGGEVSLGQLANHAADGERKRVNAVTGGGARGHVRVDARGELRVKGRLGELALLKDRALVVAARGAHDGHAEIRQITRDKVDEHVWNDGDFRINVEDEINEAHVGIDGRDKAAAQLDRHARVIRALERHRDARVHCARDWFDNDRDAAVLEQVETARLDNEVACIDGRQAGNFRQPQVAARIGDLAQFRHFLQHVDLDE